MDGCKPLSMGIGSGFNKWFNVEYAASFTSLTEAARAYRAGAGKGGEKGDGGQKGSEFDHIYIDVNNVLHVAAHHTKTEVPPGRYPLHTPYTPSIHPLDTPYTPPIHPLYTP